MMYEYINEIYKDPDCQHCGDEWEYQCLECERAEEDYEPDYGELQLSKKELRQLGKFSCECLEDWRKSTDESLWYGVQFDKRMFDLNLWDDEEGNIVCTAYECDPMLEEFPDGSVEPNWTTNINFEKFLWSVKQ